MKYLLDTNVWISALRGSNASVIGKLGSLAADDLWIAAQARANNLILVRQTSVSSLACRV